MGRGSQLCHVHGHPSIPEAAPSLASLEVGGVWPAGVSFTETRLDSLRLGILFWKESEINTCNH